MSKRIAVASGIAGAATVTVLNEVVRRVAPESAQRMEILGMRAAKAGFEAAEMDVSPRRELMPIKFAAEAFSNTAYYSLVGFVRSENAITAGATLGIAARIGAVVPPRPLGLGESPSARSAQTKLSDRRVVSRRWNSRGISTPKRRAIFVKIEPRISC